MDRAVDILHPLASVEWREYRKVPVDIGRAQTVWLKDKVYIGGATVSGNIWDEARLYIYAPTTNTWDILDTPVYHFALTTYHSQLVLVGGWECTSGLPTNKLWTLNEYNQWQETLPPLPTPLPAPGSSAVNHRDYLLVIGVDYPPSSRNKVYVFNGCQWESAQHPPQLLYFITSTIFDGHWYLMGGELNLLQKTYVYSASLDSLITSCRLGETIQLWKQLQNVPIGFCHPAVFQNVLITVGGLFSTTISLYVYSSSTQSWVHMADAPITLTVSTPCAVALSYNELMVVSGCRVFKIMLEMTCFNPESFFNRRALCFLEEAGIPVMSSLNDYTQHIQNILGLPMTHNLDLIDYWISSVWQVSPTWNNLLDVIRILNLDNLAQQIESFLSGVTQNLSPVRETDGDKEMDKQLRLRDDTIFCLRQETYAMQQRIRELKSEIGELKSHLSAAVTLKEEVGGKIVSLPVKTELTEEDTSITKATTEVSGEMTVVVYSSHYQQITWDGFGLKLHIQEGSLPAGMKQCNINIKASLAGQYEFPENSHLVSAIFWLHCETVHKFTHPIIVEIQHCAKPGRDTRIKLRFVRAVCSQKQLPYTFKQLPGGVFTSHSSYGVIELNGFSGVGITQEGSEDREYCSQLFYLGRPNSCQIHFVVTWNVAAHLTVVKEEYREALFGLHQVVEFESDAVSLDIPMEGITVRGWTITPLIRPVVTKKQVDNFVKGTVTPCCQLKAEFREEKVSNLKHQVTIQGAKYPHDVFTIDLPAEDPQGPYPKRQSRVKDAESERSTDGASTADPSSRGLDTKLTMISHFEVCDRLQLLDDNQILCVGGALGLAYNVLQKMKSLPDEMVAAWLRQEDYVSEEPTWRTLVEALRRARQAGLAKAIENDKR